MNLEHYNKYYSYDELLDDILQLPPECIDKFIMYTNPI
jgi:hypothetical protein